MAIRWLGAVLGLLTLLATPSDSVWAADDGTRGEISGGKLNDPAVLDRELLAVRALEKLGARVERDAGQPGQPVVAVVFRGERGTYLDVSVLTALPQLEALVLPNTELTESDLKVLSRLQYLRHLVLPEATAAKAGVAALRKARPRLKVFQTTGEEERKTGVVIPPAVIP